VICSECSTGMDINDWTNSFLIRQFFAKVNVRKVNVRDICLTSWIKMPYASSDDMSDHSEERWPNSEERINVKLVLKRFVFIVTWSRNGFIST